MSLYLCTFFDGIDVHGVDVGRYSDFAEFRNEVRLLQNKHTDLKLTKLLSHSDCDGAWVASELQDLKSELLSIKRHFLELPPKQFAVPWKQDIIKKFGLFTQNLHDSFFDVDGEPLIDRLIELCDVAITNQADILFQ